MEESKLIGFIVALIQESGQPSWDVYNRLQMLRQTGILTSEQVARIYREQNAPRSAVYGDDKTDYFYFGRKL